MFIQITSMLSHFVLLFLDFVSLPIGQKQRRVDGKPHQFFIITDCVIYERQTTQYNTSSCIVISHIKVTTGICMKLITVQFFCFFFKFYSHNCYFYITIQTIQIHIEATNYMSMFYLFFGIEKKEFCQKKILLWVKQTSIDMYVGGGNIFKRLVQMLLFLNMLVCFISIKCYDMLYNKQTYTTSLVGCLNLGSLYYLCEQCMWFVLKEEGSTYVCIPLYRLLFLFLQSCICIYV